MRRTPPWMLTAALGLLYVTLAPSSADLAAASYRSDLFKRAGFTLWDNGWYAGHHLPAYSVLAPALGALLGPRLLAALSATAATALFTALLARQVPATGQARVAPAAANSFSPRGARLASWWFAFGAGVELLSGRVPFDLGLALGLAALLAMSRAGSSRARSAAPALALALLCSLASPVAGAFLALAALAGASNPKLRVRALSLLTSALVPIVLLALAFPEGGTEPFAASAFWPAFTATALIAALLPNTNRALRAGAVLYAMTLVAAYLISTPVGGNAVRLGALFAGPVAACVLLSQPRSRRRALLLTATPLLLYWQLVAPIHDFAAAANDPATASSYYTPLLQRLTQLQAQRIEVVPTRDHWEARWVAPHFPLARGWERQLDQRTAPLFYTDSPLTPARYRAWLLENAVAYVALPRSPLDPSGRAEAGLLRGPGAQQARLREVWHSRDWQLFAVQEPTALTTPPATITKLTSDSFTLTAPRPGAYTVRVHFTPYWALTEGQGCVRRTPGDPGDWTTVEAHAPGRIHVAIEFSVGRMFSDGARCD